MSNKIDIPDIIMKLVYRHQSVAESIGLGTKIIEHINTKVDKIIELKAKLLEAEQLLQDYQDLIKCDYGKNPMTIKAIEDQTTLNCKNCDLFKRDCDLYDEAVKQTGKDCCDVVNYENAIAYVYKLGEDTK